MLVTQEETDFAEVAKELPLLWLLNDEQISRYHSDEKPLALVLN